MVKLLEVHTYDHTSADVPVIVQFCSISLIVLENLKWVLEVYFFTTE